MFMIGPIGFLTPWILWGLVILPLLWFLLRAVPPAPIRRRFPGVALLLGLTDEDAETDRTPWWLLLLRMLAVAAAIIGFAGPVLNPEPKQAGNAPLLIVLDGGWAEARDWPRRVERAGMVLEEAGRDGRVVAVVRLTDQPQEITFRAASDWQGRLAVIEPSPWLPQNLEAWVDRFPAENFDTLWLSDGLAHPGRDMLAGLFADKGQLTVIEGDAPVVGLHPVAFDEGAVVVSASRLVGQGGEASLEVVGRGPDPSGIERELARATIEFTGDEARAEVKMDLPPELRNRVTRFEIAGLRSAGAVTLTDDSLKRRKVALITAGPQAEGLQLLSPLHYLRQALAPVADLIEAPILTALPASPDAVVLADVARLTAPEEAALVEWVEKGGLLLRFAGPRLAASDVSRYEEDPLMPVRLREGGRALGGAMSWGDAKKLAPFPEGSPFFGLALPDDVQIAEQVLAQPDPELGTRTIAALDDGTPLVTRKFIGEGQVVLIHVTANAEWSTLPLSGLFVQMLERLAISTRPAQPGARELAGQIWVPEVTLNAWGEERDAGEVAGVPGEELADAMTAGPGPAHPPGLYAGADRRVALNVLGAEASFAAAEWPASAQIEGLALMPEQSLKGGFLSAALIALLVDILAALWLGGRLRRLGRGVAVLAVAMLAALAAPQAQAQDATGQQGAGQQGAGQQETAQQGSTAAGPQPGDDFAIRATNGVTLAFVKTGDPQIDEISDYGLRGLGDTLWQRTSIEPEPPIGIDLETDELAFFPFIYWPITADAPLPSDAAYVKLNQFLRTGGMILFDTRDANVASVGGGSSEGQALQRIAAGLDIPALEPIPEDHVLTRTFYLLQTFPGRWAEGTIWVEAAPADAAQAEGVPFRNLNDGVTPVVIGGNDWAAAWAADENGVTLLPVGRGAAGDQQREIARRFGVNLIMHVLTGNYKSDQVHVPALLDRLGQ
ncbi:DUF4159 domain-containing protein [Xinfangfangia sp. D13-10-4-6]|uniref:DUF4159 domain-containing protein n=1 Tax=Pseudogemmobacter hezensis TaxID=2737662 RepID=UPI001557C53A|nr:DUF4159 domain-containing protein [Pseudogemmobacter hezensis]NPD15573.1 DUF4159 domain-containing protein [Pseudogemmobacter hezensis]